jgi:hypothetical protein
MEHKIQFVQTDSANSWPGRSILKKGSFSGNEKGELIMIGFAGEKVWTRTVDGSIFGNLQTTVTG